MINIPIGVNKAFQLQIHFPKEYYAGVDNYFISLQWFFSHFLRLKVGDPLVDCDKHCCRARKKTPFCTDISVIHLDLLYILLEIHKVDNVGIFVLLRFENKLEINNSNINFEKF